MSQGLGRVTPPAFDAYASDYDAAIWPGLRLSGESREFFSIGRARKLSEILRRLGGRDGVRRILDFGCGTGAAACDLLDVFPLAEVVGVDVSSQMIARATRERLRPSLRFEVLDPARPIEPEFDLAYAANVFHHIDPDERALLLERLRQCLRPGGHLALFENNPWNPGARAVMARIELDSDAIPLSVIKAIRLARQAGFEVLQTGSLFYFPRALRAFRALEGPLSRFPLGAQYFVIAQPSKVAE